ncbi:DUF2914 domain-containing protein [Corallincola luteus]|uniref:DUF2914 domain-containing protein n=1 Tax=Corallincola luteus TaxID=1775177 RepID=A0ABY2AM35_9GAMM|nr:DUF2914 domain-containing protein [Corallincola luteus]TCI02632.1 DUF2914 domain-containing protein [Corallincola luteus]
MPATLNIKVNITPPEPSAQIEHQWHWRRISGLILVLACASSLLFYFVFSDEKANENLATEAAVVVANDVDKTQPVAAALPITTERLAAEVQPQTPAAEAAKLPKPAADETAEIDVEHPPVALPSEPAAANSAPLQIPPATVEETPAAEQMMPLEQEAASEPAVPTDTIGMALLQPNLVERHTLTTAIVQKEPQDKLPAGSIVTGGELQTLYYFTELSGLAGKTVHHRWLYNERVIADISLPVGSDRWRTYSSKRISASLPGQWRVELRGPSQELLAYYDFYRQP